VYIPIGASEELVELWRARVVEFFAAGRELINAAFAKKLLGWKHSGFSIESNARIYTDPSQGIALPVYRSGAGIPGKAVLGFLDEYRTLARPEEGTFSGGKQVLR
jgi:hypothetical protein